MRHIALLGDSIFDNKAYIYTKGKLDTIGHLNKILDNEDKATLLAVDGARVDDVVVQLAEVPDDITHLVISVGGNDALDEQDMLDMNVKSSKDVFYHIAFVAREFEKRYRQMLKDVLSLGLPTTLCTIYYPRFQEPAMQKLAVVGLTTFNDTIIRMAFKNKLPLIDLRLVCNHHSDYANAIEPSTRGSEKIAKAINKITNR